MSEQELLTQEKKAVDDGSTSVCPYCVNKVSSDPVDPETVKKAQNGDDEAFSKLFWQTYRYVFGIAKRYLRRDDDIYDALQDTYTRVYANLGKLKVPEAFVNWVGKIAVTCARAVADKLAAAGVDLLDDDDDLVEIDDTHDEFKKDVVIDVTAVLSQMDPADAELLTYVYYDRLKVSEIARMQGVPATTVYSRLNAAKRRLKELLKIRGIEKAVYGGDIVAIITTALRNAIGTNLLSMAVAAEILHSVTGKKTKAAAVVAAVARQQRNAAALKIASWLLAAAMLMFGIITVVYYAVKPSADRSGQNSDLTVGVSTEAQSSGDGFNSSNSYLENSNTADSSVGGAVSTDSGLNSSVISQESSSSINQGGTASGTSSTGNSSTGTSGEIGDTNDPDQNNPNTSGGTGNSSTNSSTATSSQKTSTTVSTTTSSSKPSTSSSASSSSKPSSTSSSTTSSEDEPVYVTSLPAVTSTVRFDKSTNTMGNTSNNVFSSNDGRLSRQGNFMFYRDEYWFCEIGLGGAVDDGTYEDITGFSCNVVGDYYYFTRSYNNTTRGLFRMNNDGSEVTRISSREGDSLIINGVAYIAVQQSTNNYTIYAVNISTYAESVVATNVTDSASISANEEMLIFLSNGSLYKYDLKTKKTTLFISDPRGTTTLICGQYLVYDNKIVNINQPNKVLCELSITPKYFFGCDGGLLIDRDGNGCYLSNLQNTFEVQLADGYFSWSSRAQIFGFDNDEYIYCIGYTDLGPTALYKCKADGSYSEVLVYEDYDW